jgi:hypothetical protein
MTDVLKPPSLSRRHFLIGTGGFTLAIPFLSSLLPRGTKADGSVQRRLIALGTDHGGVFPTNLYPARPSDWTTQEFHPGGGDLPRHVIGSGPLVVDRAGGQATLSRCLTAPEALLTPTLAGKMNFLGGLSITTYLGHTRGMMLGNFGANDQGTSLHSRTMATIDQIVAKSPGFALSPAKERSFNFAMNYGGGSGIRHAASADTVGGVTSAVQADTNPRTIWERLFGDQSGDAMERPELVVDRVYEHYRNLTTGAFGDASRLSSRDRQRLENHMERLLDLERRLSVRVDCGVVPQPDRAEGRERFRDAVDLAITAVACGATNVAVLTSAGERWSDDPGYTNWHEQVAHNGGGSRDSGHNPEFQRINYEAQGRFFRDVFLRISEALDGVEEEAGDTLLDRSLVMWVMESGARTHSNICMPVITAGSAAGAFATGRFTDYRNLDNQHFIREPDSPETHPGVLYNQFLASVLRGMGVTPEEWGSELARVFPDEVADGARGYGAAEYHPSNFWSGRRSVRDVVWPFAYYERADDPLPFFSLA